MSQTRREFKSFICGFILGDGSFEVNGQCKNARVSIKHCLKNSDYVKWKQTYFLNNLDISFNYKEGIDSGKYAFARSTSRNHRYITKLRRMFYENGVKTFPHKVIERNFDLFALSILFFDEGHTRWSKVSGVPLQFELCICGFSPEDATWCSDLIQRITGLYSRVTIYRGKYPKLMFYGENARKMIQLMRPFADNFPSMLYKVDYTAYKEYTLQKGISRQSARHPIEG